MKNHRLANVNTTNLHDAVALGCRTISHVFNADDHDIAFFGSSVRPIPGFGFHPFHSESHIPGRHLNALLNAENALGIAVEESVIEKHRRAAFFSYSGPVALPLNRDKIGGRLVNFAPHNIREGLHALYALVAFRACGQAHDIAEKSIAAIFDLWHPETGWNRQRLEGAWELKIIDFDSPFIGGLARAIGPLVKYFRVTRSAPALHLATVLKDKAIAEYFPASGECDIRKLGTHTHSITCVVSSLAQLAEETRDAPLMERVKSFYDNGLRQISNALGWSLENAGPNANPDRGEANNTGDILETALILGRWGDTECYHHAERILRGHLLPSQLRDVSFISDPPNPQKRDDKRDVAQRHLGAFGFPTPYGHQPVGQEEISFNLDIVGGAVGSLCEAYRAALHTDARGHFVNLLFDHETEAVRVQSPYPGGTLRIHVKRPAPLWVRLPPWATGAGSPLSDRHALPRLVNGYVFFASPPKRLTLNLPLRSEELILRCKARQIRARLEGDQVRQMENFGTDLTFFDPLP